VIEHIRTHQESAGAEVPRIRRRLTVDRDADLVERLGRREPGATEALAAVYGDRAYRLAIGITGNHSDAEEVVQDALWTVVRRIETFTVRSFCCTTCRLAVYVGSAEATRGAVGGSTSEPLYRGGGRGIDD
jgi:hypothetical protein